MDERHNVLIMILMLVVFAIIFFIAFAGLKTDEALFNIGIPIVLENYLIMFLSAGSIAKIVYEIVR